MFESGVPSGAGVEFDSDFTSVGDADLTVGIAVDVDDTVDLDLEDLLEVGDETNRESFSGDSLNFTTLLGLEALDAPLPEDVAFAEGVDLADLVPDMVESVMS